MAKKNLAGLKAPTVIERARVKRELRDATRSITCESPEIIGFGVIPYSP
jgi:hypothetical protein